jgi:gliding motility-associated lipoprotein GldD
MYLYPVRIPVLISLLLVITVSCKNDNYMPKQRGYFYIPLPEKKYNSFEEPTYPYSFEIPVYSVAVKDTVFFDERPENPYWLNLQFSGLNAQLHLTYKTISNPDQLDRLIADSYKLTFKHTVRAEYIDETPLSHPGKGGILYEVGGDAASPVQFFLTDSSSHFLRGALYFNAEPRADSLAPVTDFLYKDIVRLVETLEWK